MACILGISAYYHDAAAALVVNGQLIAAMQEERFSRIKNDPALPLRAARACLEYAHLDPAQVDAIVYYENPFAKLERLLSWQLRSFPRALRQFPVAMAEQLGTKLWVLDAIAEGLDVDRRKVRPSCHHRCHAASAFFTSAFEDAAVLTVDGAGEHATTTLWRGAGRSLDRLGQIDFPHSLGLLYGAVTAYLGFQVGEGESKVMGLAGFGTPRYLDEFRRLIQVAEDGSFALDLKYFAYDSLSAVGFSRHMETLLGPRRMIGAEWNFPLSAADVRYADIAASLQRATEDALLAIARHLRVRTGARALCLAGGVALNAVANARLLAEAGFAEVYVHPAAGDAGGAVGAAILGALDAGDPRPAALECLALGAAPDALRARDLALKLGFSAAHCTAPAETVADLLNRDKIVAVCTGRFEWGPRALGQRSILALPRDVATREHLNRVIKRREAFRPFAPAVRAHHADRYFEPGANAMTPFMTTVCSVRESCRAELGAVTHVDGTARVQTVTAGSAPFLYEVLERLEAGGGGQVLLNTSLNGRGEPIAASANDALGFFCSHDVDALVVGDYCITREGR